MTEHPARTSHAALPVSVGGRGACSISSLEALCHVDRSEFTLALCSSRLSFPDAIF